MTASTSKTADLSAAAARAAVAHECLLEDDVFVGPQATFTNDPFPRKRPFECRTTTIRTTSARTRDLAQFPIETALKARAIPWCEPPPRE